MSTILNDVKQGSPAPTKADLQEKLTDFSLVLGGPIFQLFRKAHLNGDHLELLHRRVLAIVSIAWLPMLVLDLFASQPGIPGRLPFLRDVEVQARFLVALPVLILGELIVHSRLRSVVQRFVQRRIVRGEDLPRFDAAIESTVRLRNSIPVELALLASVYTLGLWLWNSRFGIETPTWYANPGGRWNLTPAGWWYVFIGIPIIQFVLLRWYFRFLIWYRFLWRVSRLNLHLVPIHPDHSAGIAFLGKSAYAFGPILFAQGAMLAGLVASRVLYRGESLQSFRLQMGGFVVFFVVAVLGPLLMFTPKMTAARRKGLADYAQVGQGYVDRFEEKWVLNTPASEEVLGSGDFQSLADLDTGYDIVRGMRMVPFGLDDITRLAAATAAPLAPLLLTIFSAEELILRLVKLVF
ncbi:MAG: hypothetical protein ABI759_30455 [Candidatus Solibacter sp.]